MTFFVIVNAIVLGIDGGRLISIRFVLHFEHVQRPPYFRFEKIVIFGKDSIDRIRVFFKTLYKFYGYSRSTITFLQSSCEVLSMLLYNLQLFFHAQ